MVQISIFDGSEKFKISKPIRLIELFAGYGSQSLALKYLGIPFESWRICEWAVKSIQAYKDMHTEDDTDYSQSLTRAEVIDTLFSLGISADYNAPMTMEQIKRMGEKRERVVYNNIKATRNLVNIQRVRAEDLCIEDTDRFCYIMTYSFPCQDLSRAGKGKGMAKDSGTRSGMLWEVERILDECREKPQVLIMENVPDVVGTKNIKDFVAWRDKLESLGYRCYWQILNGKHYGVPQNRERCFMISVLGDYYYEFPSAVHLEKSLLDVLEENVPEKYYIKDKEVEYFVKHTEDMKAQGNGFKFAPIDCSQDVQVERESKPNNRNESVEPDGRHVRCGIIVANKGRTIIKKRISRGRFWRDTGKDFQINGNRGNGMGFTADSYNRFFAKNGYVPKFFNPYHEKEISNICPTLNTICGGGTNSATVLIMEGNKRMRKLTPRECFRLMGVKDEDYEKIAKNQSDTSLYHLAGDSIIVDVLMAIMKEMKE